MPGVLYNSPADVVRWLLIQLGKSAINLANGLVIPAGLVTDPSLSGAWPCYCAGEPDSPDNCVTVYDTVGRDDGRSMIDGERYEHFGFQIRVRGTLPTSGFLKARQIKVAMDQAVRMASVSVGAHSFTVPAISTSPAQAIGKDGSTSKRNLFTINGVVAINELV